MTAFNAQNGSQPDADSIARRMNALEAAQLSPVRGYSLSSTAVPMVLPSSGSIGNNGALTLTTAIPLTGGYTAGCYMYFPAGAVFSASAAGLYFVVMNANNSGTIYANTYTSGTPTIPDSPTPIVATGPGAYTQTTSPIDLLTRTIPANSMGRNGYLIHQPAFLFPNNANNKVVSTVFGGANVFGKTRTTTTQETPLIDIRNMGVANRQSSAWGNSGGPATASTAGILNLSIDTTADVSLISRGQLAVATDYIIVVSDAVIVNPFS